MTRVECDNYIFDFTDAITAFKFDETDKLSPHYHGAPMKAVDIIAEFEDSYVFVELKNFDDITMYDVRAAITDEEEVEKRRAFRWLKNYLKYKYRDTLLYRYAEHKLDKPVHYVCLLSLDNALNITLKKSLRKELPVGKPSRRWVEDLSKSCQVVNFDLWNQNYPKWKITPINR